jgi:hypothetical protein
VYVTQTSRKETNKQTKVEVKESNIYSAELKILSEMKQNK